MGVAIPILSTHVMILLISSSSIFSHLRRIKVCCDSILLFAVASEIGRIPKNIFELGI